MTDKFKSAFNNICAENDLKENTLLYLQKKMHKRSIISGSISVKRFTVVLASVAVLFLSGLFSYNIYYNPNVYVDVDVNPSVELVINRFDRVIGVYAYNLDGEDIISKLDLKHKNYKESLRALIYAIDQKEYIQSGSLVSVTLQTENINREDELLAEIQDGVSSGVYEHHDMVRIEVFSVSDDTRSQAYELDITPAKYLAIQELMEIDPTVTVDSCKGHSVGEIKQMTQGHKRNHHGNSSNNDTESENDNNRNCDDTTHESQGVDVQNMEENGYRHRGNNSGHHGERTHSQEE